MQSNEIHIGHSYVFSFGGECVLKVIIHWPHLKAWSVVDQGTGQEAMLYDGHLPLVVREADDSDLDAVRNKRALAGV